jgi:hypothetical protein
MYRLLIHRIVVALTSILLVTPASAITGVWSGQLYSADGQEDSVMYGFSDAGNPVFPIETRDGTRNIEISRAGQTQEWLVRGGGVARGRVEALSVSANRVHAVVSIYTESGGGSLMNQREQRFDIDFMQAGNGLQVRVATESASYASGSGVGYFGGRSTRNVWQGVLQRVR